MAESVSIKPFSAKKVEAAKKAGKYSRWTAGKGAVSQVALSGALKMWAKDPNFVYIPSYGIAGNYNELLSLTAAQGVDLGGKMPADAIGLSNYQSMPDKVALITQKTKRSGGPGKRSFDPETVRLLHRFSKRSKEIVYDTTEKGKGKNAHPKRKDLNERILALPAGKYLDVSNYAKKDGNIRTTDKVSTKKAPLSTYRVISDNEAAMAKFLHDLSKSKLGQDVTGLIAEWRANHAAKALIKGTVVQPVFAPVAPVQPVFAPVAPVQPVFMPAQAPVQPVAFQPAVRMSPTGRTVIQPIPPAGFAVASPQGFTLANPPTVVQTSPRMTGNV
jgi:hypothetical protein